MTFQSNTGSSLEAQVKQLSEQLYREHLHRIYCRTDLMFAMLMPLQWVLALLIAFTFSPKTWVGTTSSTNVHVWMAIYFGGCITLFPVYVAFKFRGTCFTRHVIAIGQLLMSALLIDVSGGQIEMHFHIFGSLAFLAFYRDWKVLVTATIVTALDHIAGGIYWPVSVYGVPFPEPWLWMEHVAWVVFEDVFLLLSCKWGLQELAGICSKDATLQSQKLILEEMVEQRTSSLKEANQRLEAIATTDPLTGLPNHRSLVDAIEKELNRSSRYGRSFSVLFLDIDHFKALNDTLGHSGGDSALEELGALIKNLIRGIDTAGRWGGEEFLVLLPETDADGASLIAEKIRSEVAAHLFLNDKGLYLTCSFGVASYPSDALAISDLVESADKAMYAAKKMGRNQVRLFSDPILNSLDNTDAESREEAALQGMMDALVGLVDVRDVYTGEHSEEVCKVASGIAVSLGYSGFDLKQVKQVALLHDVGKIAIPDAILQKPGVLTSDEWDIMKRHPAIGAPVVGRVPDLRGAAAGIRSHHERWDGTGYPDGLKGEKIPLAARIVAVADTFSAITSDRPYRNAESIQDALAEIDRCSGTQFDPMVVRALHTYLEQSGEQQDAA